MNEPDILIITTHDGGRHLGCYGVPTAQTPEIDDLAADGVRFERLFAASPISSPSGGALLTGRDPRANRLVGLAGGVWQREFNDDRQHLSHIARRGLSDRHDRVATRNRTMNTVQPAPSVPTTGPQVMMRLSDGKQLAALHGWLA